MVYYLDPTNTCKQAYKYLFGDINIKAITISTPSLNTYNKNCILRYSLKLTILLPKEH